MTSQAEQLKQAAAELDKALQVFMLKTAALDRCDMTAVAWSLPDRWLGLRFNIAQNIALLRNANTAKRIGELLTAAQAPVKADRPGGMLAGFYRR